MIEVVDKNVVRYTVDGAQNSRWSKSEFPHPLITVDLDQEGAVIGVTVVIPDSVVKNL